jgi:hypothetical protein
MLVLGQVVMQSGGGVRQVVRQVVVVSQAGEVVGGVWAAVEETAVEVVGTVHVECSGEVQLEGGRD